MKKIKGNKLVYIAYSSLAISILSGFTTIIGYTNIKGIHRTFNMFDLLLDTNEFGSFIFDEYGGEIFIQYENYQVIILVVVGTIAIACAFAGLMRLSKQTDNKLSFLLTLFGLIGTMAPSLIIFILIVALKDNYLGTISCGIYPIVSPVAMIICIIDTVEIRKRNTEYRKKLKEAEGLIFKGGSL